MILCCLKRSLVTFRSTPILLDLQVYATFLPGEVWLCLLPSPNGCHVSMQSAARHLQIVNSASRNIYPTLARSRSTKSRIFSWLCAVRRLQSGHELDHLRVRVLKCSLRLKIPVLTLYSGFFHLINAAALNDLHKRLADTTSGATFGFIATEDAASILNRFSLDTSVVSHSLPLSIIPAAWGKFLSL